MSVIVTCDVAGCHDKETTGEWFPDGPPRGWGFVRDGKAMLILCPAHTTAWQDVASKAYALADEIRGKALAGFLAGNNNK